MLQLAKEIDDRLNDYNKEDIKEFAKIVDEAIIKGNRLNLRTLNNK